MSNGFYFVPQTLYDLLEQQAQRDAQGDVKTTLRKIVDDFLARDDNGLIINAYSDPQPYNPKVMDGDQFDYPTFWQRVDSAGLKAQAGTSRDKVMSAALSHHFAKAAAPAGSLTTLQVPIEKNLYARLRQRALETGKTPHDIISGCVQRYLSAPAQFEKPLTYQKGDTLTIFHYHIKDDMVAALAAVVPAHRQPLHNPDARDIVALAVATDFKRMDQAALAARTAQDRIAQRRDDSRYKL